MSDMSDIVPPSLLPTTQVVETPGTLYLVMEHSPNGSLLDYVRKCTSVKCTSVKCTASVFAPGLICWTPSGGERRKNHLNLKPPTSNHRPGPREEKAS